MPAVLQLENVRILDNDCQKLESFHTTILTVFQCNTNFSIWEIG